MLFLFVCLFVCLYVCVLFVFVCFLGRSVQEEKTEKSK